MSHLFAQADALRLPLPDQSVDLVLGSPPYLEARTYLEDGRDLGIARGLDDWVSWMLQVTAESLRVSRGAVIWIAAGCTRGRNYLPACERLMSEWNRGVPGSGIWQDGIELPLLPPSYCHAYRPCYWHRVGIPGSGGDQWFRADVEYAMCFKRPGELPWTDNTACGHAPKWAPGGEMSNRLSDGSRVNRWGAGGKQTSRDKNGIPRRQYYGEGKGYDAPAIANPGNYIPIDEQHSSVVKTNAGAGHLGHPLAHSNEAPYPEDLAAFFIKSLCPPGGIVLDCYSGSGTTVSVADRLGRNGIGLDLRMSQCKLGKQRLERPHAPVVKSQANESPMPLFAELT